MVKPNKDDFVLHGFMGVNGDLAKIKEPTPAQLDTSRVEVVTQKTLADDVAGPAVVGLCAELEGEIPHHPGADYPTLHPGGTIIG